MDTRRHAPLGRVRPRLVPSSTRSRPHAYLGRSGRPLAEIYVSDHADTRRSGRFRWLLSTCLAGAVGVLAILVVIAGSMDTQEGAGTFIAGIEDRLRNAPIALRLPAAKVDGLRWAIPKTDKLVLPTGAIATRSYIPDGIRQRRGNRDYILQKYYVRLVARLAPVPRQAAQSIPPFSPSLLYTNTTPLEDGERAAGQPEPAVSLHELNGILADEDGQELDAQEVAALVARSIEDASDAAGGEILAERALRSTDAPVPQTTVLAKTVFEQEDQSDDSHAVLPIRVQRGDTLARILARQGAPSWQIRAMIDAGRPIFAENLLQPGFEVRVILVPTPAKPNGELARFSIFDDAGVHKLTVTRTATGDYMPSATPNEDRIAMPAVEGGRIRDNSLYASMRYTSSKQGVPDELINQIMRIHAYTADFSQPIRVGDGVEFFFDMKGEDRGVDGELGDLLATFVTSQGETHRFYRFQDSEGTVDFYDAEGSTSRKFLTRRPVRGENVRITSGFGMRRHPLLSTGRMHTGVDWAAAYGTPIMAAGDGVIEEAGAKGEYGNYIRIRHANGYKTAYGHMSRYAPGAVAGVRVRQGQIIGYVGSTGLSSGPHCHFEVLINGAHVNPMSIQVPNDRKLSGKDLVDFKRERARIDELMRRHPVATRVVTAGI